MKRTAPAADRNKQPILEVLGEVLPASGLVLEIASGTGQHAAFFAKELQRIVWQPSDCDPVALASTASYVDEGGIDNLRAPLALDVTRRPWPLTEAAAVVCINMLHISPWSATLALFAGVSEILARGGPLVLYGPYIIDGATAPSNRAFDQRLRAENPEWGVRELRTLEGAAQAVGLSLDRVLALPANNHVVVFRQA